MDTKDKKIVLIETDVRDGNKVTRVKYDDGTEKTFIRPLF